MKKQKKRYSTTKIALLGLGGITVFAGMLSGILFLISPIASPRIVEVTETPTAIVTLATEQPATPTLTQTPYPTPTVTQIPTKTQATSRIVAGDQGVNVRSGPGTSYDLLGYLDPGVTTGVTGYYEDWWQIRYGSSLGWVYSTLVVASAIDDVVQVEPPPLAATATPSPLPTSLLPTEVPAPPPTNAPPCDCSSNLYNCDLKDFTRQTYAQVCFDYCISIGRGDIHDLDRDKDGIACEVLP